MREIEHGDQILHLEAALHYSLDIILIPFLEVDSLELVCLFCDLLEDDGVVVKRAVDVLKMLEPNRSFEVELVQ